MPDPAVFTGKLLHKDGTTRLATRCSKADNIERTGREPATQAAIYDVKGTELKIEISGSGSLRAPESSGEEDGPSIQEVLPRVYDQVNVVLVLTGAILALGFVLIYRQPGRPTPLSQPPSRRRENAADERRLRRGDLEVLRRLPRTA